jgi:hypothetical protein
LIVMLLMAKLRFGTPVSDEAARTYYTERAHSYGSYFGAYKARYGNDATDFDARVKAGANGGWGLILAFLRRSEPCDGINVLRPALIPN